MQRKAPNSGRPDTAETREKLLSAALVEFARDGYRLASVRDICASAGVNSALVSYHFGGKEGLYREVVARVCWSVGIRIEGAIAVARQSLVTERRQLTVDAVCRLIEPIMEMVLDDATNDWARLMFHEQSQPGPGFAMFHDRLFEPCVELLAALIAKQRGCAPADEHTVAALGIFGMLFIFRSASSSCARLIPDGIDKTAHRIVLSNAIRCAVAGQ